MTVAALGTWRPEIVLGSPEHLEGVTFIQMVSSERL